MRPKTDKTALDTGPSKADTLAEEIVKRIEATAIIANRQLFTVPGPGRENAILRSYRMAQKTLSTLPTPHTGRRSEAGCTLLVCPSQPLSEGSGPLVFALTSAAM